MAASERFCHPVSRGELERRWAAVREIMREENCEALIVQGLNNFMGTGGHYRWLTGVSVATSYPSTLIFPLDGLSTAVAHGGFGERVEVNDTDPTAPGLGLRLFAPSFPGVNYCGQLDAELIVAELKRAGYRRIATLAPSIWLAGMALGLRQLAPEIELVDVTPQVDIVKAEKSAEELAALRATAALQDMIMEKIRDHIRPGMKDYEVMAYGQYLGQLMGAEGGYFLGSSAPPGEPTMVRRRIEQGRTIQEGDVLYFQCENNGPGGLFTHIGRYFVLGHAPQQLVDMFGMAVEAQDFTMSLLKPGTKCADIFEEYNRYMVARGSSPERRVHCHGQGYDVVEPPLIRQDETMILGRNVNMGFHPAITRGKLMVTCCDNLFVNAGGQVERLHQTAREIVELV